MDILSAELIAKQLMRDHEFWDWNFKWLNAKTTFGRCDYSTKTISLSRPLTVVNDEHHVRDVILHEIAHAMAGFSAGHGYQWQKIAKSLGARPERCASADINLAPPKWNRVCDNCGRKRPAHRRTNTSRACGKCCRELNGNKFTYLYLLRWELA